LRPNRPYKGLRASISSSRFFKNLLCLNYGNQHIAPQQSPA
jgi:hypothetical protein